MLNLSLQVRITVEGVRFENLVVRGIEAQRCVVAVFSGSSLALVGSHVEGGAAVAMGVSGGGVGGGGVSGGGVGGLGGDCNISSSGCLCASRSVIHSSAGVGLSVADGARAVLEEQCSVSDNGGYGVAVCGKGSRLIVLHSGVDRNQSDNIRVLDGAQADLQHVTSDSSKSANGWSVSGEGR